MNKGFTLVELVITLALLIVIISIAVPNVNRMILRNRENQLARTHNIICEAARAYAHQSGSCRSVSNIEAQAGLKIVDADCEINSELRVWHLVENGMVDGNLSDPTISGGDGRYDYDRALIYRMTTTGGVRSLEIRLGTGTNQHICQ